MNFNFRTIVSKTFILILLCSGGMLSAQVFQKVGTGINAPQPASVSGVCSWSDASGVYFGYSETTYNPYQTQSHVAKWDGVQWMQFPTLPAQQISAVAIYNGDLYAAAYQWGNNSNVYRFDGTNWVPVFSNITGFIQDLEVHNGNLICAGSFHEASTGNHGIVAYDGSSAVSIPTLEQTDSVEDVNVINNELWVSGTLYGHNRGDTAHVKKLTSGTTWTSPAIAHDTPRGWYRGRGVFEYNSKVYMLGSNELWEIKNDTAHSVSSISASGEYAVQGGKVFLTDWQNLQVFDGTTMAAVANAPRQVSAITEEGGMLFGFFNDTIYGNHRDYNHVFQTNAQFGLLSGLTYRDDNSNCTYEAGTDATIGRMRVVARGTNPAQILSDYRDGTYQVALAPGNYTFSNVTSFTRLNRYLVPACNNASSISIQANQNYTEDFVVQHDGTVDVETSWHPFIRHRARQGFTEGYTLKVLNPGAAITSPFDVTITVPSTITLVSMTPQATSVSGNTYTFTFPGIGERNTEDIQFQFKIDLSTNATNDTLRFYSDISGISNDAFPANDKDTLLQRVVGACDPNDKTPSVEKSLPGLDQLDYHIRFQNTGTDTAYKVVIVDTLETYLNPASIVINASSHDYDFDIRKERILVWTFDNILLPDSGANQMGSRGFVDFTIDVDPNLAIGDTIDNDAEIYFDFQPPVHTNHAKTAIVQWVSQEEFEERKSLVEIFPNPATHKIRIRSKSTKDFKYQLLDATGKLLDEIEVKANSETIYPLKDLPQGVYLLKSEAETLRLIVN